MGREESQRSGLHVPELQGLPCNQLHLGPSQRQSQKVCRKPGGLADPVHPQCWLRPRLLLLAVKCAVYFNGELYLLKGLNFCKIFEKNQILIQIIRIQWQKYCIYSMPWTLKGLLSQQRLQTCSLLFLFAEVSKDCEVSVRCHHKIIQREPLTHRACKLEHPNI